MKNPLIMDGGFEMELSIIDAERLIKLGMIEYCISHEAYHITDAHTWATVCEELKVDVNKVLTDTGEVLLGPALSKFTHDMEPGTVVYFESLPHFIREELEKLAGEGMVVGIMVGQNNSIGVIGNNELADPKRFSEMQNRATARGEEIGRFSEFAQEFDINGVMEDMMNNLMFTNREQSPKIKARTYEEARISAKTLLVDESDNNIFLVLLVTGVINMLDRPLSVIIDTLAARAYDNEKSWTDWHEELVTDIYNKLKQWGSIIEKN